MNRLSRRRGWSCFNRKYLGNLVLGRRRGDGCCCCENRNRRFSIVRDRRRRRRCSKSRWLLLIWGRHGSNRRGLGSRRCRRGHGEVRSWGSSMHLLLRLSLRLLDRSRDRLGSTKIEKVRLLRWRRRSLITESCIRSRSSRKVTRRGRIVAGTAKVATAISLTTHHATG